MPIWTSIVNLHKRHLKAIAENTNRQIQIAKGSIDVTRQFNLTAHCSQRSSLQARHWWSAASLLVQNGAVTSDGQHLLHKQVLCMCCSDHTGAQWRGSIKVPLDTKQVNWAKMSHVRQFHKEADIFHRRNCVRAFIPLILTQTDRDRRGMRKTKGIMGGGNPGYDPCRLARRQRWSQQETEEEARAATPLWSSTWAGVCALEATAKPVTHTCFIRH